MAGRESQYHNPPKKRPSCEVCDANGYVKLNNLTVVGNRVVERKELPTATVAGIAYCVAEHAVTGSARCEDLGACALLALMLRI